MLDISLFPKVSPWHYCAISVWYTICIKPLPSHAFINYSFNVPDILLDVKQTKTYKTSSFFFFFTECCSVFLFCCCCCFVFFFFFFFCFYKLLLWRSSWLNGGGMQITTIILIPNKYWVHTLCILFHIFSLNVDRKLPK